MSARSIWPVLIFSTASLLGCGGAEERKADHLQKAVHFYEQGNAEKAAIELKNVLQIDPKAAQPYYYLGRIQEDKKNWQQAFGYFQKAVELDPAYRDAQFHLARFLLMAKQIAKAEELLAPVAKERPKDQDVRMLQIAIENAKGNGAEARKALRRLLAEKPNDPEPFIALALMSSQSGDPKGAETALRDGLAVLPKSPRLLAALARFYMEQKQSAEGERAIRELIAAEPGQLLHRISLSQLYFQQSRWEDVEATLRQAVGDFPKESQPVLALTDFHLRRGEPKKAEGELRAGMTAHPQALDLAAALAGLLERTDQPDPAMAVYRDFIAANEDQPQGVKAQASLGELLARRGRHPEALALAESILKEHPRDFHALLLKGKLALTQDNARDAIDAFRSILKDQPESTEVLALLASAFQLDHKPALAQEQLERAVQIKPGDFALRRNLVQFLVQQKIPSLAMDQANDFLKREPDNLDGLNLKADLLALNRDEAGLEAAIRDMKAHFADKPVAYYRLGNLYTSRKDYASAATEYESATEKSGNAYDPLKALITTYLALKQPDRAQARLEKILTNDPTHAGAQQLMGLLQLNRNRPEEGVAFLNRAIELNPNWLVPYLNLGSYYEKQDQVEPAVAIYQKALATVADDIGTQLELNLALANLLRRKGDFPRAEQVYRDFLVKAGDRPEAAKTKLALADFLARRGRAEEGEALVDSVLASQPAEPQALLWKARLALSRKQPAPAISGLQKLLQDQPDSTEALSLLASAYFANGEPAKAREPLEHAVRAAPGDFSLRRRLAELLVQQKQPGDALTLAEQYLADQPGSLEGLSLKADVLAAEKRNEELESTLKEIRKKHPEQVGGALGLGRFHLNRKDYGAAMAEFDAARRLSGNSYDSILATASLHMEMQQPEKALALVKKIMTDEPKRADMQQQLAALLFSQKRDEEAVRALNQAIELKPDWLPPYANLGAYHEKRGQTEAALAVYRKALAVAPRDLTMQLSLARVHEMAKQYGQAKKVYETVLQNNPDHLLAINNLASILTLPGAAPADLQRALELSRRLDGEQEPAFRDTLAWVHYLAGDLQQALTLQVPVAQGNPEVPVYQYHLGMMYLKQGDAASARQYLAKAMEIRSEFIGSEEAKIALQKLQ